MHLDTGELRDAVCDRNGCEVCGPRRARVLAHAIALQDPQRFATLTLVGLTLPQLRARLNRLVHAIRSESFRWEHAWVVQANPRSTGLHVHALQWGSFVPQRRLSELAKSKGLGAVVDIRAVQEGAAAAKYGLRAMDAARYALRDAESVREHLALNGGRLAHASRGFWRVGATQKGAMRSARGDVDDAWVRVLR